MEKRNTNKNGSMVIEFALLTTLLLIPILAGMWDLSQLIDMNQIMTRAAREGVVMASRGDDPVARVKEYVESAGLPAANLSVTVQLGPEDPIVGQEVVVTLNYDFTENTIYPWDELIPDGLNTVAHAKME
ncbi:TadE/TadG family type IV pilus assembly protein [Pseudodesulfovibrio sediminis]|uniref:TadE-like domain-containing protein n=1 Tax=Pseudodesulfovibrio sediminis TaxID=2810563 RepID=A0ABM7P9G6_9BACT|nr:TadE/TadG family type IV pilus assembly protein [Pseudodesulfovibrio sediminis]BCS89717.1 hypothetical protein PSDVSF_29590 [Pseudodesulfovibrio sediminis]